MCNNIELGQPYDRALTEALAYLHDRFRPTAVIVSGSIVRGAAHATSDFDIVVVHNASWRQRVQRRFSGVPTEMFVNPAFQLERQMQLDSREGRPVMAHMLATGMLVHDTNDIGDVLQATAVANLAAGPQTDNQWLLLKKYGIATGFEDAVDIREIDESRANAMLTDALIEAVKWHFLNLGRWLPRPKALLADLDALDPGLGRQVRIALQRTNLDERLAIAQPLVERMVGTTGFFEWESEPQVLPPKDYRP